MNAVPSSSVAVLLPVYNALTDAWRTLVSLDEPDWPVLRVLVVDDGSQPAFDPAAPLAGPLPANLRIEVLRFERNGGIEAALAAGVARLLGNGNGDDRDAARVDYIARIDAGDLALPGRFSKQRRYLDAHPRVGAVGMWAQAVRRVAAGAAPGAAPAYVPAYVLAPPAAPAAIRRQRFARSCFIHPAMMIRGDAIRRAGNYRATYPAAEDLDLFLRIMRRDDCANLPEIGIRYELNDTGISATRRRQQIRSTLRLQMRHAEPLNPFYWLGLAKNLTHMIMPYAWLQSLKHRLFARGPEASASATPAPSAAPDAPDAPAAPATPRAHADAMTPAGAAGRPALHICLVSNTAWSILNYRRGLLEALAQAGAQVTIVAPRDAAFASLTAMGFTCIELALASQGTRPVEDLRTLASLWRIYRRMRPDVVFHYTIKPNIYGTLAAALARVPSVAVTTGLGYVFLHASRAARIAQALYRLAFRFPREVWFLNPDDRDAFLSRGLLAHPERARLLRGEGVDLTRFAVRPHAPDGRFRFLLIGRLLWDKGVGEFIDAARQLKAHFPEACWQLLGPVGVANPSAISRAEVDAWCAEGLIDYLGEADDVRPYIAAADCIVLPSYREGVPRTLLEAAAMGRIAIATRVPGCVEVVEDGVNGILCEARSAQRLAEAMQRVLCLSAQQRETMEGAARRKAEREFDERVVIDAYQQTLDQISGKTIFLSGKQI